MRAVRHHAHGGLDTLVVDDVPIPEPGPGEALIRVEACSVNFLDIQQRRGPALIPGFQLPHTAGMDVAGVVESGDGIAAGTRVVVNPAVPCDDCETCRSGRDGHCPATKVIGGTIPGGYAEYVVVPTANLYPVPEGRSLVEAAVVPTVWMTAHHALHVTGRAASGETVLIHAGGSGVSTAAIQLARAAGLRVISTVSRPEKADYVRTIGADVVIDTSSQDIVGTVREATGGRGVDLVLDHVGPATWAAGIFSLAARGRLVFFGNTTGDVAETNLVYAYHFGLQLLGSDPYDRSEFAPVLDTYWNGDFVTPIDSEFPLADARAAQEHLELRRATGKVVLRP
ncbi:zinc-binding dehydrogenase [Cryptosporangium phraense]|uniref:Zinc-binding dehydrogenase n=1 Tax=Cryptosporangium phraense TaxID=2593070 RepID=A0A545AVB0_9ACTN|nr:zinc-binding dehydrogenase [Cryptosporangium phraense]TQS45269.1 zinc-binding dehydrogenase [Cryptosporangium phraense]